MLGAITGDVIGSHYESFPVKRFDFELFPESATFTDDTVLTTAVAEWLLRGRKNLTRKLQRYVAKYPDAGYGNAFRSWAQCARTEPYNSWGNGSAMRVSPVAYAVETVGDVLSLAKETAEVTHNHPDGVRGAQAVAVAVFLSRTGHAKDEIRRFVESQFGYDCSTPLDEIRDEYSFDVSCSGSVPQSITAFLESHDVESAIRNAVSPGGDADTMACIVGAIAEPHYGGLPTPLARRVRPLLTNHILDVIDRFYERFLPGTSAC